MQEMPVPSLGPEDPLEKEMISHSSIFAWAISRTEEPAGYIHRVSKSRSDTTERLNNNNKEACVCGSRRLSLG